MLAVNKETKQFFLKPYQECFCLTTYNNILDAMSAAKRLSSEKMKNVVVYRKQEINTYVQMCTIKFFKASMFDFLTRLIKVNSLAAEDCSSDVKSENNKAVNDNEEKNEVEPNIILEDWDDM